MKGGWEVKALGEVCQIKPPKKLAKVNLSDADEVSFVPMNDLGELEKTFEAKKKKPLASVYGGYTYFADDDVLVAKITPCFENGKLGIAKNLTNGVGFGSSEFVPLRSNGSIVPEYLFYFLLRNEFRENGARIMTGAVGHKRVPKEYFEELPIPLPPLEEQQRIVAVLDAAFEGLARARAHASANLQNARELFESGLDSLFQSERHTWQAGKLGGLVGSVSTGPFGSLLHKADYVEGQTPIINPAHIADGAIVPDLRKTVSDEAKQRLKNYVLKAGDIVIGRRGEMGRCAVITETENGWLCGTGSFFIRPNGKVRPAFVAYLLRSRSYVEKLESVATGATMLNISNKVLSDLEVELPTLEQQTAYLVTISEMGVFCDKAAARYQTKLQDLDDLRQSLLQKAFAGELT